MTTRDFLAALEPHAERPLAFEGDGFGVPAGFHVTEIKATQVQAMDCGGRATTWDEAVMQLWAPPARDASTMTVGKFLSIFRRVTEELPLAETAAVRVEYGAAGASAVNYLVTAVEAGGPTVVVRLAAPAVACKANDRSLGDLPMVGAAAPPVPGACC